MSCKVPFNATIGSHGSVRVTKGNYLYTGSALGRGAVSLEGRIKRHLRSSKPAKWHVDSFTTQARTQVLAAVSVRSPRRLECLINDSIMSRLPTAPVFL